MGFERVAIFGLIDLQVEATAGGTLYLATDLPGNSITLRESKTIPITPRRVMRFRLQGTTKGRLYVVKIVPIGSGVIRLYGGRIYARVLPGAEWAWYAIPIPETSEEWSPMKLPIPETGEWAPAKLPIPETGEWGPAKLPIPETGEWGPAKLPIPETGEWAPSKLPIPETSDWMPAKLPIKPTPQNPEWVDIEVDQ